MPLKHDSAHYRPVDGVERHWPAIPDEILDFIGTNGIPPTVASNGLCSPHDATMVTFVLFTDWGREAVTSLKALSKYYIVENNVTGVDLSDIKATGGSCASYFGEHVALPQAFTAPAPFVDAWLPSAGGHIGFGSF